MSTSWSGGEHGIRRVHAFVGRSIVRIAAGALLVWYGLTQIIGPAGWLVAAVGLVPIAAGVVNFCLIGPFFGLTLMGQRPATRA